MTNQIDITKNKCVPCEVGMPPLLPEEIAEYKKQLKTNWVISDDKKISREFKFKDFKEAINFVNEIAKIAEEEGHHPDIYIYYNKVKIDLATHAIGGLSPNDFILAGKIEKLVNSKQ